MGNMISLEEYKIEHLTNFNELADFYTGKKQMDVWSMCNAIWPEE